MATKVEKSEGKTYLAEVIAIALFAIAVLVFLSLFSYHESDPSIITSSTQKTRNWIGTVGANTAAVIFSVIGYVAYVLPFLLALSAWKIFQSKIILPTKGKILGFLLFLLSAPTLLTVFDVYGAIIGTFLGEILIEFLGKVGSSVVLFACVIISLLLITDASFSGVFDGFKQAFATLLSGFKRTVERYRKWKEEQEKKAKERLERRNKMRLENKRAISLDVLLQNEEITEESAPSAESETHPPIILSGSELETQEATENKAENKPEIENTAVTNDEKALKTNESTTEQKEQVANKALSQNSEIIKQSETSKAKAPQNKKAKQSFENYVLPSTEYLTLPPPHLEQREEELLETARLIVEKAKEFNVTGRVVHICQGPVVTTYEFKPDPGVKYSKIVSLADDLCLALKAESIRIDRIPGKAYVGIEVPNKKREVIYLREIIESKKFRESESLLTIALGKTIDGANYVTDLAKMPHLLIAGATGSGKSVGVNALIVSILYRARPDEVKFIMVDPKRLELGVYADIPHLATPIITDPKRASVALKWAVSEMERRYKYLAGWGVRNIDGY
ncbi:MAG: DNA translocase FtsK 4TM domain-containing protein, partial [Pyrinomonadaceae bacterium]